MKKYIFFLVFLLGNTLSAQINFDNYFLDKTLRLDYIIGGNSDNSLVYFEQYKEEPFWGGSKKNLIDKFNYGDFRVLVYDKTGANLIYSRGYSSLFYEWKDTEEAKNSDKSFYESVVIPYPKTEVKIKLQIRDKKGVFHEMGKYNFSPTSYSVIKDKQTLYKTHELLNSGDYHKTLDIVIIPDGYTQSEISKFHTDCKRFMEYFFETEPFKSNKNKISFSAVDAISEESGTDIPGKGVWKNTVLNTHFYTFDTERYLTTQDINTVRNIAAYVPYDQIYILVNTEIYGGGGIYNYYNLCSSDNAESGKVFSHEFGHAFVALADEYEYGYENAEDLYDMKTEPWQVNITNLVDFDGKWKNLVEPTTIIPTSDKKENQKLIGAFEGAGYVKKGIYRPTYDCKMRSNNTKEFCPVCLKATKDMLNFYSE